MLVEHCQAYLASPHCSSVLQHNCNRGLMGRFGAALFSRALAAIPISFASMRTTGGRVVQGRCGKSVDRIDFASGRPVNSPGGWRIEPGCSVAEVEAAGAVEGFLRVPTGQALGRTDSRSRRGWL